MYAIRIANHVSHLADTESRMDCENGAVRLSSGKKASVGQE